LQSKGAHLGKNCHRAAQHALALHFKYVSYIYKSQLILFIANYDCVWIFLVSNLSRLIIDLTDLICTRAVWYTQLLHAHYQFTMYNSIIAVWFYFHKHSTTHMHITSGLVNFLALTLIV